MTPKKWTLLYPRDAKGREVRMSPSGIVVVEDIIADGKIRHTRVTPDGKYAQTIGGSPMNAWSQARKLVA